MTNIQTRGTRLPDHSILANGSAAAAILASGAGCFVLGVLALAADVSKAFARLLIFYEPTGPLSGVTCSSIFLWLLTWFVLARRWNGKSVAIAKTNALAFVLLGVGLLLSFPPFMDFLR